MTDERHIRYKVAAAARHLDTTGMNPGRSGNLSARLERGFVITPSGAPYDSMHPDDLVFLDDEGEYGGGQGAGQQGDGQKRGPQPGSGRDKKGKIGL